MEGINFHILIHAYYLNNAFINNLLIVGEFLTYDSSSRAVSMTHICLSFKCAQLTLINATQIHNLCSLRPNHDFHMTLLGRCL